jgi:hypothetical protein
MGVNATTAEDDHDAMYSHTTTTMYEVCLLNTRKGSVAGAPLTGEVA